MKTSSRPHRGSRRKWQVSLVVIRLDMLKYISHSVNLEEEKTSYHSKMV